jgi:D-beta-D-heptose 7-phosphate kinase/D-beta-D-heptose 1-phosphate adenosyltransferase
MKKIVLVTGGFDPLHSGHIAYFKSASQLGDELWVALNSDAWLARKKGRSFMPIKERASIVEELACVKQVITGFNDDDDSACDAIRWAKLIGARKIVFANGGDRGSENTPEQQAYSEDSTVEFVFGVGGTDKKNSSSWILKDWKAPKTERSWGHYRELYSGDGFAVKELVINPHSKLSMQRHKHRSETWNLVSGIAQVMMNKSNTEPFDGCSKQILTPPNPVDIPAGVWHQGVNNSDEPAHIVEVWKGPSELLSEDDIERYE